MTNSLEMPWNGGPSERNFDMEFVEEYEAAPSFDFDLACPLKYLPQPVTLEAHLLLFCLQCMNLLSLICQVLLLRLFSNINFILTNQKTIQILTLFPAMMTLTSILIPRRRETNKGMGSSVQSGAPSCH